MSQPEEGLTFMEPNFEEDSWFAQADEEQVENYQFYPQNNNQSYCDNEIDPNIHPDYYNIEPLEKSKDSQVKCVHKGLMNNDFPNSSQEKYDNNFLKYNQFNFDYDYQPQFDLSFNQDSINGNNPFNFENQEVNFFDKLNFSFQNSNDIFNNNNDDINNNNNQNGQVNQARTEMENIQGKILLQQEIFADIDDSYMQEFAEDILNQLDLFATHNKSYLKKQSKKQKINVENLPNLKLNQSASFSAMDQSSASTQHSSSTCDNSTSFSSEEENIKKQQQLFNQQQQQQKCQQNKNNQSISNDSMLKEDEEEQHKTSSQDSHLSPKALQISYQFTKFVIEQLLILEVYPNTNFKERQLHYLEIRNKQRENSIKMFLEILKQQPLEILEKVVGSLKRQMKGVSKGEKTKKNKKLQDYGRQIACFIGLELIIGEFPQYFENISASYLLNFRTYKRPCDVYRNRIHDEGCKQQILDVKGKRKLNNQ